MGLSVGAIVGISIGALVGFILLVLLINSLCEIGLFSCDIEGVCEFCCGETCDCPCCETCCENCCLCCEMGAVSQTCSCDCDCQYCFAYMCACCCPMNDEMQSRHDKYRENRRQRKMHRKHHGNILPMVQDKTLDDAQAIQHVEEAGNYNINTAQQQQQEASQSQIRRGFSAVSNTNQAISNVNQNMSGSNVNVNNNNQNNNTTTIFMEGGTVVQGKNPTTITTNVNQEQFIAPTYSPNPVFAAASSSSNV